jgi:hypothetical protein
MKKLTAKEVLRKYKGKFIEVNELPFWDTNDQGDKLFEVYKNYSSIRENTTFVKDLDFINNY